MTLAKALPTYFYVLAMAWASIRLSVRLFVRPSVTRWHCIKTETPKITKSLLWAASSLVFRNKSSHVSFAQITCYFRCTRSDGDTTRWWRCYQINRLNCRNGFTTATAP